jgi:putative holliday junction resolvase
VSAPVRGVRLGVDVGTVRVGVARSDPDGLLAVPVATLPRQEALTRLAELVQEHDAVEICVGHPVGLSGRAGPASDAAAAFAEELATTVAPVPVRLVDERLSTVSATAALRSSGVRGRNQRAVVDQAAAVVLLQAELDRRRSGRMT